MWWETLSNLPCAPHVEEVRLRDHKAAFVRHCASLSTSFITLGVPWASPKARLCAFNGTCIITVTDRREEKEQGGGGVYNARRH